MLISLCEDPPTTASGEPLPPPPPLPQGDLGAALSVLDSAAGPPQVSIHVSSILTGKLLARIDQRALLDRANITALAFSEETGDIITGNEQGRVQVWSA